MQNVIIRPIITEKMTASGEKYNRYGFVVNSAANKIQIKEAVEKAYNVSVEAVKTVNYVGKVKTRNTKSGLAVGRVNKSKRAIVFVKQGDTIDFYSNI